MKQKAKLSMIGAFVIGASVLASAMVVTFGAGEFFKVKDEYVLYFEDSLKGLDVGAPVRFLGVKVGSVTGIELVFDSKSLSFRTPVFIEVDTDRITLRDYGIENDRILGSINEDKFRSELIERGLRAQLKVDSLLTGKLYVDIGLHPDKEYSLTGNSKDVQELPTMLSGISELTRTMENLPVEAIVEGVLSTVESIDHLITSLEETNTLNDISDAVKEFKILVKDARKAINPITASIEETAKETRQLVVNSDAGMQRTFDTLEEVGASTQAMMSKAEKTLERLESTLGEGSAVSYRINRMVSEISEAARAMRTLAEYLERHPEALVFGKGKDKGD
ncbi:paraquat-inducible protein B [Desulfoluna limicola]|uniref:Paraquat-inducible protein B n=1 Tax=Desulfoluna limicola TaxID=2810562 RepID=A0ABM7PIK2_9BACT|nr:MlaD family protein [Desulfoluna limicola]BCS97073.1 paraquat-inducible protein B [Desulfoluna limicola]